MLSARVGPFAQGQSISDWMGAVNESHIDEPQRAVSIVNMDDSKAVFLIGMAPSWLTYRVKAVQPLQPQSQVGCDGTR